MWVAPADAIYSKTPEELENESVIARSQSEALSDEAISTSDIEMYYVFGKLSQQAQCSFLGDVEAHSPATAMQAALSQFQGHKPLWWWVLPAKSVLGSTPDDAEPMFAPARAKTFKRQSEYPVVTLMRQLHSKGKLEE
jgi:1,2-phenylacetyl-CoA epoxidase PaaB subunit